MSVVIPKCKYCNSELHKDDEDIWGKKREYWYICPKCGASYHARYYNGELQKENWIEGEQAVDFKCRTDSKLYCSQCPHIGYCDIANVCDGDCSNCDITTCDNYPDTMDGDEL